MMAPRSEPNRSPDHRDSLLRRLAILFLRSTARGSLAEAVPDEPAGRQGRVLAALRVGTLMRWVGRAVGRVLSPATKARIQDALINRFRIPVSLQEDETRFRRVLRRALRRQREGLGHEQVGHYFEFGVYQGSSMIQALHAVAEEELDHVRLFGFDSFAGLPATAEEEGVWSNGQYRIDEEFTRQQIDEHGVEPWRAALVPGFFAETLTPEWRQVNNVERASVIMIDCDLYSSAKEALTFCEPLIDSETVLLFDDWHATAEGEGEQRAFAEFLDENEQFEVEPFDSHHDNAQGFVLKRLYSWFMGAALSWWKWPAVLDTIVEGESLALLAALAV